MERMLIWCESKPIGGDSSVSDTEKAFSPGRCLHFQSAPHFTRWLFEQERGPDVLPQAVLVCGPREAKPCAQALLAARTGDHHGLRVDEKAMKTSKVPMTRSEGLNNIVVGAIICIGKRRRQLSKLQDWLQLQREVLPLSCVSCGIQELLPRLQEMAAYMEHERHSRLLHLSLSEAAHGTRSLEDRNVSDLATQQWSQTSPPESSVDANGTVHGDWSRVYAPSHELPNRLDRGLSWHEALDSFVNSTLAQWQLAHGVVCSVP